MRDLAVLFVHLLTTIAKLMRPGGARAVVAESLLLKQQLIVLNRPRQRARNLRASDRIITAIVDMKRRNPRFGCRRIAQQISFTFGIEIDKDIVRRMLAKYFRPDPRAGGPSWLTLLGHTKDSLWSMDLFRCESLILKSHWVMVIMDQYSRRIIGFAAHAGAVDGVAVYRMFNRIVAGKDAPHYLSSDNDPLFKYHRWKADLRILDVTEIKSVAYVPMSHPFVERLVGTVRREFLDHTPFWHARDLERKLLAFRDYFNSSRGHHSLSGVTPVASAGNGNHNIVDLNNYRWQRQCRGLYQLPVAA